MRNRLLSPRVQVALQLSADEATAGGRRRTRKAMAAAYSDNMDAKGAAPKTPCTLDYM